MTLNSKGVIDMNDMKELIAERIGGAAFSSNDSSFKFERIKRAKRQAILNHPDMDLIDLGVGEPDGMADHGIIKELYLQAQKPENRGYADNGIDEFQNAAAKYMQQVYGVVGLNHHNEILPVMGSKSALAMIPQAFINPHDITLLTVPGYPIIGTMTQWLGGEPYELPLYEENRFLPDLKNIPNDIIKRTKLLYINYPNNPTGAVATKEFYQDIIQFAKKHNILVVQDAAYAALTFYGEMPLSILSVPGAMDVCIEIHSLSKAFSMTGWRLGFAVGNQMVIKALASVKDNNDSGQFKAIQHAGVYALNHPELTIETNQTYARRHEKLAVALQSIGFQVNIPRASFYQYIRIPKGTSSGTLFLTAEDFSNYLIEHLLISTIPWDDVGNYIRLSVTFIASSKEQEDVVIDELTKRLQSCNFIF